MQDGLDMLYKVAVEQFHHPIVLQCVMSSEPPLSALFIQELGKCSAGVLTAMVGPEAFDLNAVLCVRPHREGLVGVKSLVLSAEDLEVAVVGVIIREGNVIFVPSQACNQRGSPQVGVYLGTKTGHK